MSTNADDLNPFDRGLASPDARGVRRYPDLHPSLTAMLRASVARDPDAEALVQVGGGRLTYAGMWDAAGRVAGGLRDRGVEPGDCVALRRPNGIDWVVAFFGILRADAVAVPINTRFGDEEVAFVVGDSQAVVHLGPDDPLPDGDPPTDAADQRADDVAALFYTSGTTGFPKGARTTHENVLANSRNALTCLALDDVASADLRTLVSVPLFHVTGCHSQLVPILERGGTVVILPALELDAFLGALDAERITALVSVPAIYQLVIEHPRFAEVDAGRVRSLAYGGAPIAPTLVRRIAEAFPNARVGNGFGLTESASLLTFLPHEDAAEHADSVGYAVPSVDLRLDAPDEQGVGELLARGQNVTDGYHDRPDETRRTYEDGWLRTGDLATIDDAGRVRIVDRAKDLINRGGENVSSIEVEAALASAPGVGEACVLAVPAERLGEKVGAILVPAPGADLDVEAVVAHVAGRLAGFKVPQYAVVRREPLPRNAGGKVLKKDLREAVDWGAPLR